MFQISPITWQETEWAYFQKCQTCLLMLIFAWLTQNSYTSFPLFFRCSISSVKCGSGVINVNLPWNLYGSFSTTKGEFCLFSNRCVLDLYDRSCTYNYAVFRLYSEILISFKYAESPKKSYKGKHNKSQSDGSQTWCGLMTGS